MSSPADSRQNGIVSAQQRESEKTADITTTEPRNNGTKSKALPVLQVERRDYIDLAPKNRARAHSMEGFDDVYTDIVDYIMRCTHRIWDERDIGLIYTHYTHNCTLYSTMQTLYDRESIVRDTIQRLVTFPDRVVMGTQVVWNGNDKDGFYSSHLVTGTYRHTQPGQFGPPTGRTVVDRVMADCMVYRNRIYREWVVGDNLAVIKQLGLDPTVYAREAAKKLFDKGVELIDIGDNRRCQGQVPPEEEPDISLANNEIETETLYWLHHVFNRRMFGQIEKVYARNAQYHGPKMVELYGSASILHQHLALLGSIPDASYVPQHICSTSCEEGGVKIAVRWIMEGHHLGHGLLSPELGAPTGHRLQIMGITHYHYKNGCIVDEWNVYDGLSLCMQIELAKMVQEARRASHDK